MTRHRQTVSVLGVPISCLTMDETLTQMEAMLVAKVPSLVVTADATSLVIAHENPEFRRILDSAALITADSVGVLWALRRACGRDVEKVSGVDLVARLVERSSQTGARIYFLGAEPGVAELAAERLRLQYPGCNIVGTRHGYFPSDSDEVVAQEIAEVKPDILFVAMGMPRQEEFILKTQGIIGASVAMGVGGSLDVYSGRAKRAPKAFIAARLEWLWRLLLNPKKIVKVKSLPKFVALVVREPK